MFRNIDAMYCCHFFFIGDKNVRCNVSRSNSGYCVTILMVVLFILLLIASVMVLELVVIVYSGMVAVRFVMMAVDFIRIRANGVSIPICSVLSAVDHQNFFFFQRVEFIKKLS